MTEKSLSILTSIIIMLLSLLTACGAAYAISSDVVHDFTNCIFYPTINDYFCNITHILITILVVIVVFFSTMVLLYFALTLYLAHQLRKDIYEK